MHTGLSDYTLFKSNDYEIFNFDLTVTSSLILYGYLINVESINTCVSNSSPYKDNAVGPIHELKPVFSSVSTVSFLSP